jgi:phosphoglycolate phosphatase-like HAD superfamily hydrolase
MGAREAGEVLQHVDRGTLEQIFKELYVGARHFGELFGEEPRFYVGPGAMEAEVPLAEGPLWDRAQLQPFGILTGRIPPEARVATERLGIGDVIDPRHMVTDDGRFPTKPDPAGLLYLAGCLAGRPLFYFGDNRDDLSALVAAREEEGSGELRFVYCLSGSTDKDTVRWFSAAGASLMAVEVTDALAVLLS